MEQILLDIYSSIQFKPDATRAGIGTGRYNSELGVKSGAMFDEDR